MHTNSCRNLFGGHQSAWRAIIVSMCIMALFTGCMDRPLNNSLLQNYSDPVTFHGYDINSDDTIQIWVKNNNTSTFEQWITVKPDGQPWKDSKGMTWYPWETVQQLPLGIQYWKRVGHKLYIVLKRNDDDLQLRVQRFANCDYFGAESLWRRG